MIAHAQRASNLQRPPLVCVANFTLLNARNTPIYNEDIEVAVKRVNNQNGFSLIMVLIAIGVIGALGMSMLSLFRSFNAQSRHFSSMVGGRALLSTLQGIVAYPNLCIANLDPASRNFDAVQAATTEGVPMSLFLGGGATGPTAKAGSNLSNYDVGVESLNFTNAHPIGTDPNISGNTLYSGELILQLKKMGASSEVAGGNTLRDRSVGVMTISVDPTTNTIGGCFALTDARQSCKEVGGTYDDTSFPKCKMPYPCEGKGNAIFLGYDKNGVAQCKSMAQIVGDMCPAGQYVVSDGSGGIKCKTP